MDKKMKYGIILQIIFIVIITIGFIGCGSGEKKNDEKENLRIRAVAFGNLLINIQDMDEFDVKEKLEEFIEPSSNIDEKIDQYYDDFSATSEKARITSQSVEHIDIYPNKIDGAVIYHTEGELLNGRKIVAKQITKWKKINNKWYRTIEEPEKELDY